MSAIGKYQSGEMMVDDILRGVFQSDEKKTSTDFESLKSGSGRISGTSFLARFSRNSQASNQSATCEEIVAKLMESHSHSQIAKAFENKFWFSKMIGSRISRGSVVSFLDQQIVKQKSHDLNNHLSLPSPQTSLLAKLFWRRRTSSSETTTSSDSADSLASQSSKTRLEVATKAPLAGSQKNLTGTDFAFLWNLAVKIESAIDQRIKRQEAETFDIFNQFYEEAATEKSVILFPQEKQIIFALHAYAESEAGKSQPLAIEASFSARLDHCFRGIALNIAKARDALEKKEAINKRLINLYNEVPLDIRRQFPVKR